MFGWSISKNSLLLGTFALVTAAIMASTYQLTRDRIVEAERKAATAALLEIIPEEQHDNDMLTETLPVPAEALGQLGLRSPEPIHLARRASHIVAVIIPSVAPDGYSGDIRMIVGVNSDGTVAGVRVLTHNETPGLGDKIELKKDDWILTFTGLSLENPERGDWNVRKDGGVFDQFTGATITPRAVVQQVRRTLDFAQTHQTLLFPDDASAADAGAIDAIDKSTDTPTSTTGHSP